MTFILFMQLKNDPHNYSGGLAGNVYITGSNQTYAVLVGLFSAISGGISYCLVRAAAKTSEEPV